MPDLGVVQTIVEPEAWQGLAVRASDGFKCHAHSLRFSCLGTDGGYPLEQSES